MVLAQLWPAFQVEFGIRPRSHVATGKRKGKPPRPRKLALVFFVFWLFCQGESRFPHWRPQWPPRIETPVAIAAEKGNFACYCCGPFAPSDNSLLFPTTPVTGVMMHPRAKSRRWFSCFSCPAADNNRASDAGSLPLSPLAHLGNLAPYDQPQHFVSSLLLFAHVIHVIICIVSRDHATSPLHPI